MIVLELQGFEVVSSEMGRKGYMHVCGAATSKHYNSSSMIGRTDRKRETHRFVNIMGTQCQGNEFTLMPGQTSGVHLSKLLAVKFLILFSWSAPSHLGSAEKPPLR